MASGKEESERPADSAAQAGRVAGSAVNALGKRLLRIRSVREAVRRAGEEVRKPDSPDSGSAS